MALDSPKKFLKVDSVSISFSWVSSKSYLMTAWSISNCANLVLFDNCGLPDNVNCPISSWTSHIQTKGPKGVDDKMSDWNKTRQNRSYRLNDSKSVSVDLHSADFTNRLYCTECTVGPTVHGDRLYSGTDCTFSTDRMYQLYQLYRRHRPTAPQTVPTAQTDWTECTTECTECTTVPSITTVPTAPATASSAPFVPSVSRLYRLHRPTVLQTVPTVQTDWAECTTDCTDCNEYTECTDWDCTEHTA